MTEREDDNHVEPGDQDDRSVESRRKFLKSTVSLGAVGASGLIGGAALTAPASAEAAGGPFGDGNVRRAIEARNIRVAAARDHFRDTLRLPTQETNGDDERYAHENYYGSFTKTLPSNGFGEVDPSAYRKLLFAVATGRSRDFDRIPLDPSAGRRLENPQGAFRFIYAGLDGHATRMRPAPTLRGAETSAEAGEVWWQALTRDVPFNRYDSDPTIAAAVADLNDFSATVGPKVGGQVTPGTLFRGETPGDLIGPYISQFLWKDVPFGPTRTVQRFEVSTAGLDFMIDQANWLNIQRGGNPLEPATFDPTFRYIYDNRALGEYVHRDALFQAYFNAGLIIIGTYGGAAVDPNNPYFNGTVTNQTGFSELGGPFMLDLVTKAGNLGLNSAWYQKWVAHRRLRPEAYGGRVQFNMTGQRNYELGSEFMSSQAAAETFSRNGNYFLPMGFIEGSPTHPAYPAGHATVAGCCSTVLKAFFDESFVIPDPVVSNDDGTALLPYTGPDLTIGGELNKIANNVAIGRDAAGVHWRSDGIDGVLVGEQQAIALLEDYSRAVNVDFDGFNLTKFDGTSVVIRDGDTFPA